ncbi:hypothetical protein [Actinocrispum sp. NPDC049592]|uniref:hypothetical protein n=1 Tax=Actinocrispum sp. NPDC049592 TaxID=3154835 RepID=UPI00342AA8FF
MTVHVVIQPAAGYVAEVFEPSPGVRQLIAGNDEAGLSIQVPARVGGLSDTATFARALADAATVFAAWCEEQNSTRSFTHEPGDSWAEVRALRPHDHKS